VSEVVRETRKVWMVLKGDEVRGIYYDEATAREMALKIIPSMHVIQAMRPGGLIDVSPVSLRTIFINDEVLDDEYKLPFEDERS